MRASPYGGCPIYEGEPGSYSAPMLAITQLLYPRLRSFPPEEQSQVLQRARALPFDVVELVGFAIGLVLVTMVVSYSIGELSALRRLLAILLNFVIALPLLALFAGPFWVRRTRRGLEQEWAKRSPT